ncbi:unnamed protein product [Triticum turgidum subsp. durum]|uniref:Uncharacterized protein n=1 Tax=Triticum turgidum subsp. durum TaxID=4567 RepID=A0A9R0ZB29_TRITD|nr:unnamed protein product [Triticum turgidum subsp. durum]
MLWRYIAYRHDFIENTEDIGAQPLGDESDLECEIEPFPKPSNEAAAEASRFAKVIATNDPNNSIFNSLKNLTILIYGPSREQCSSHRVNSEVPLLNTPNEKIPRVPSDKQLAQSHRLTNGTGPISNSKQASHTGLSPDPFDGNGPHKKTKKPKAWSNKEDADLMDGVHKCGEGNWLNILHRYKFGSTRTYVQLSQRWAVICRRQGTTKPAKAKSVTTEFDIKATQKAFSMALDMPMGKPGGFSTLRSGASQQSTQHPAPVFVAAAPELKCATSSSSFPLPVPVPAQGQIPLPWAQPAPAQAAASKVSNTSNKSRNSSKKQNAQANPTNAPSSIQAAAIAAGGRIAPASIATNLLKAAQSSQAVHITPKAMPIRPRGKGSSRTTSSKASTMAGEPGTQPGSAEHPELPNCSAPTPSPPVLVTQSIEQVNLVSEVAGVKPPEQSASAHLLEPDRALSTTPVSGPCDNMEMDDDSTFCAVTMEDLFPEDVKQPEMVNQPEIVKQPEMIDPKAEESIDPKDADMLEFDRFVAQGCLTTDCLDKSKGVKIAPGAQGAIPSQKKQPKQQPTVVKSVPVSARGAPATVKKTKTLASHGATFPSTVTSSGLVGTGNAVRNAVPATGTLAKNMAPVTGAPARNAAPGTGITPTRNLLTGTGTPPARNSLTGTATPPVRTAAPGTGTPPVRNPAPSAGTPPGRNSLTGTRTPASRQYTPVVNGPSKGNPPASQ